MFLGVPLDSHTGGNLQMKNVFFWVITTYNTLQRCGLSAQTLLVQVWVTAVLKPLIAFVLFCVVKKLKPFRISWVVFACCSFLRSQIPSDFKASTGQS